MAQNVTAQSFLISEIPCLRWSSKKENHTRKKKFEKAYEIEVTFEDGTVVKDVMDYLDSGAARDCYKLRELPMVLKWFHETTDARYASLHPGELQGYREASGSPMARYLPAVYATRKQYVQDTHQYRTEVDCLLSEFVGKTLRQVLARGNLTAADVRKLFVQLLVAASAFASADISWGHDFHSGNICYQTTRKVWMLVDLESMEKFPGLKTTEVNKAGKRLRDDLRNETGLAFQELKSCLENFMIIQTAGHNQFDGINVAPIAGMLNVDLDSLEARRAML